MTVHSSLRTVLAVSICLLAATSVAQAQYSGGAGEPNDPYQIATAADLIALGETPDDYDKYFILTADIDLDPNLPGSRVFDRAVIAPDTNDYADEWGDHFTGVFDGNGHIISRMTINGNSYLGLFGSLFGAAVSNLILEAVDVNGTGGNVGSLAGRSCLGSSLISIYSSGVVRGFSVVGGLVGDNYGTVNASYSNGGVSGNWLIGGLVGLNSGTVTQCWSSATVTGHESQIGGLVGGNVGKITMSYSNGDVTGNSQVGGLAGSHWTDHGFGTTIRGVITSCYSSGMVNGNQDVGGLVGGLPRPTGTGWVEDPQHSPGVFNMPMSFWDIEISGQSESDGGTGLTTAEMQTASTFLEAGWDFIGETENGPNDVWKIVEGQTYPLLSWQKYGGGTGEPNAPYLIYTAEHLNALGAEPNDYDKHFKLMADIDLSGYTYDRAVIAPDTDDFEPGFQGTSFTGLFDGNGHIISHLTIEGDIWLGLFGRLAPGAMISNLGLDVVDIDGTSDYVGSIVGYNEGHITQSYSTGTVIGDDDVGGLVGYNGGSIANSRSSNAVSGNDYVGGLVGRNGGNITSSYSTGSVLGHEGDGPVGGLVGSASPEELVGSTTRSFWDRETSGQAISDGGIGLTTAEMQTASTFLEASWDFIDETENGAEDIWKIAEGFDYPRLWWEQYDGQVTLEPGQRFTVTVESNPSTGYRWEWVDRQESILEQIGEAEFKPRETGDPPLVGAGGLEIFTFEAVSPGQMTLELVYRRAWDEGVEPLKTFSVQVVVP